MLVTVHVPWEPIHCVSQDEANSNFIIAIWQHSASSQLYISTPYSCPSVSVTTEYMS
jgi:hypothetical protein